MVMPMPDPGMAQGNPELDKYKPLLVLIAVGYFGVFIMTSTAGAMSNSISYVFIIIAAVLMVMRPDCMGQCVVMITVFAAMTFFLDAVNVLQQLTNPYPDAAHFLSVDCPKYIPAVLAEDKNVTDYGNASAVTLFGSGTEVSVEINFCASGLYRLLNLAQLFALSLHVATVALGVRMFKAAQPPPDEQAQGMVPMNNFSGVAGPGQGTGQPSFSIWQGEGRSMNS